MIKHAWIAGALCVALATAAGAEEDVTKHPGYVDFGMLNLFGKEDTNVEIFLDQNILKMIGAFGGDDPEFKELVSKLRQIRVQSFAIEPGKVDELESKTAEISKKLESQGWSTLVRVRDRQEDSQTYVYMKWKDDKSQGLVVMNVEPHKEATFLNIVGEIDPEKIEALSRKVNIGNMDSLDLRGLGGYDPDRKRKR
jgi:hypothetical protein